MRLLKSITLVTLAFSISACEDEPLPSESVASTGSTVASEHSIQQSQAGDDVVEVGVIFDGVPPVSQAEESLLKGYGGEITHRYQVIRAVTIRVPETALDDIRANPLVKAAGKPGPVFISQGDVKGWERLDPEDGHGFDDPAVMPLYGSRTVFGGTGIDCDNADLNCAGGKSFAPDGSPFDEDGAPGNGHETGVASILRRA